MKRISFFLLMSLFFAGCAMPSQQLIADNGVFVETRSSKEEVIKALVQILTREGYTIDTINEKYGVITTKPNVISTASVMEKIQEPGRLFANTSHTVEFAAAVEDGGVRIKTTARILGDKTQAIDTFRSAKLNDFYIKELNQDLQKEGL